MKCSRFSPTARWRARIPIQFVPLGRMANRLRRRQRLQGAPGRSESRAACQETTPAGTCCDDTGPVRGGFPQERYYQFEASFFFAASLVDPYGFHGRQGTAADLRDPAGRKRKLGHLERSRSCPKRLPSWHGHPGRYLPGVGRLVAVPRSLSTLWAAPVRQGPSPRTSPQSLPAPLRALQKAPRVRPRSTTSRTARGLFPDYQVVLGLGSSGAFFPFGIGLIYTYILQAPSARPVRTGHREDGSFVGAPARVP